MLHGASVVECESLLDIIGFDTSDIVGVGGVEVVHEEVERISELRPNSPLVRLLIGPS